MSGFLKQGISFSFSVALLMYGAAANAAPHARTPRASDEVFQIPRTYWGEYNASLDKCGTVRSDSRLVISADQLAFYESVGLLKELLVLKDGGIVIRAEFTGEGERWSALDAFSLSPDGKVLTMTVPRSTDAKQSVFKRFRCPDGRR